MFETAELGRKIGKADFKEFEPTLRVGLLTVQYELRESGFPVIVLLAGNDGLGCREVSNVLHEWMDPRYLEANVFERPTEEELERPRFWRYWRTLPSRGRIGLYLREWTSRALVDHLLGEIDDAGLDARIRDIESFERTLVSDGALLVKCWLHVPRKALQRRIERASKRPGRAFRVTTEDRAILEHYDQITSVASRMIRETSRDGAAWNIIESSDARYRDVTVAQLLIHSLTKRLGEPPRPRPRKRKSGVSNPITVLDRVDLGKKLDKPDYEKRLARLWRRLSKLSERAHRKGIASVLVFEGWDAAGKGGVIRRLTRAMDAAHFRVLPIAAPTDEELAHHYLWRFWRHLPRAGHVALFDRSWYGRVLVERVEGLTREEDWSRAYAEIGDFEDQLVARGIVVVKIWLHISREEQLARFKAREKVPFKKYKITPEDYRNRESWSEYEVAADEMIQRTSTETAPWHLVAGNDKRWARTETLRIYCDALTKALKKNGKKK